MALWAFAKKQLYLGCKKTKASYPIATAKAAQSKAMRIKWWVLYGRRKMTAGLELYAALKNKGIRLVLYQLDRLE